jgi:hypothetical protein
MKEVKIDTLVPDDKNFNQGTQYGQHLIEESLRRFGAGRSILLDKNNRIIAGNKTIENAAAIGMDNVIVVETTGDKVVAVKRTDIDLDTKEGREMALADNATSAVNLRWDEDALKQAETEFGIAPSEWGVEDFEVESSQQTPTNSELDVNDFGDKIKMTLEFSIEEHAFVQQSLSVEGLSKEQVLLNLLGYAEG